MGTKTFQDDDQNKGVAFEDEKLWQKDNRNFEMKDSMLFEFPIKYTTQRRHLSYFANIATKAGYIFRQQ